MLYTIPDYYKEFHCVADQCEDTCCAGWQIVIDKKTLKQYRKMTGDFGRVMRRKVNWLTGTFRQNKEKRCAFLNDCNLCDLYLHEGESGFCKTCRLYPRHIEEFENVREISLSISCPEAARILLNKKEPVAYLSYEKAGEEEYEDFDPFLFSLLEDARKAMLSILQNRENSLGVRTLLVLGMSHDMQGRINRAELFDCFSVIDKYSGKKAEAFADKMVAKRKKTRFALAQELYDKLYELELLREDWDNLLLESQVLLYGKGESAYNELVQAFANGMKLGETLTGDETKASGGPSDTGKLAEEVTIQMEQLLVYFLYTYMPGAVYDGNVFSKVQMSVYCVWMIYELWMARYAKNGGELSMEERIDLTYRFSREVEHSDNNRNKVERMMEKNWLL